jgi:ATP-dependent exoDNAse (exonuclease V) beta subunit
VRVFEQVRDLINALPTPDGEPAEIPLVRSFRTHRPLVNAFNYVFKQLLVRDPSSPVAEYEVEFGRPMEAHRETPPSDGPSLEIMLLDKRPRDVDDVPLEDTNCSKGMIGSDEIRALEAANIAARIRELVENGQPVHDKTTNTYRPMQYGDVALLFRKTRPMSIYENALREAGVPYVTVAGHGYYNRQEVWDLLALLDTLYNPEDALALAMVLRSPLFNLSDEALYGLRHAASGESAPSSLWRALRDHKKMRVPAAESAKVARAWSILKALRATAGRVTIYELLREALAQTGYLATLTGLPDGVRRRNNVLKLLQKAVESDRVTLSGFTQYLNDMTDREVREGEADTEAANAVTLMTCHKSKGLEFPVVFLPDASSTGGGGRNQPLVRPSPLGGLTCRVPDDVGDLQDPNLFKVTKDIQKKREEAESKRLFYVAATRARDLLFVSGAACWGGKKWSRLSGWLGMLAAVFGLETWAGLDDTLHFGDGADRFSVRVWRPRPAVGATQTERDTPQTLWDANPVQQGEPLGDTVAPPALVGRVPYAPQRVAYHLTATQIAHLGSAAYDPTYRDVFRQSLLYDSPAHISRARLPGKEDQPVSERKLGEISHEALRWWRLPKHSKDMHDTLANYAWKYGVVEPDRIEYAVKTTNNWLRAFKLPSDGVYAWAEAAQVVLRELPFVYRTEKHVIHGILDMLMKRDNGTWVIVDYKSSNVPGYRTNLAGKGVSMNRQLVEDHARRYYLQVGVYAAAVEQYLREQGEDVQAADIKVYIYYLRYSRQVEVTYEAWRAALDDLEAQIGKLIEDDTP